MSSPPKATHQSPRPKFVALRRSQAKSAPDPQIGALWTISDVATFLNVSRRQIYRLVDCHSLPHIIIPETLLRFDPADVVEFKNGCKRTEVIS